MTFDAEFEEGKMAGCEMATHIEPEFQKILAAWQRAEMIDGVNPDDWRKDPFGRVIKFLDHDRRSSKFGWYAAHVSQHHKKINKDLFYLEALHVKGLPVQSARTG